MAEIQLLLTDDANREALATLVAEHHTPVTDPELRDAELHLIDDASLPTYRDALVAHKRDHAPVFCPVVLIRRDRTPVEVELPEPDPDPVEEALLVNETVTAPVDRTTLFRRIANLLVRRRQTTELRRQNERLERFAGVVSHDLRNPLNVAQGRLEMARTGTDNPHLDTAADAVDRSIDMVADLLALVRDGDDIDDTEPVDLAALAGERLGALETDGATVHVETGRTVEADRGRLERLLDNLLRNAVEHGGPAPTVTLGDCDGGFYVADDGPGIPEADRERVFDGDYSTGGTGLGLYIVREVAEAHGWSVRLTGSATGGARFEVTGVDSG